MAKLYIPKTKRTQVFNVTYLDGYEAINLNICSKIGRKSIFFIEIRWCYTVFNSLGVTLSIFADFFEKHLYDYELKSCTAKIQHTN